ncbi:site-specific integrase [uncultured Alistipes sp.]|uniref:site-specific integrase n=1 Tax=uncultured Alistipes sp. TaxID=538949 RepID=UPI0025ED4768|nr:site-specific integrase [uncultured Alistipes sp.]
MASVTAFIRVSRKRIDRANVRFRLRDGRGIQLFHASELEINPSDWDATRQEIKAKVLYDAEKRAAFNKAVAERKNMMLELYNAAPIKEGLTSEWLEQEIDKRLHPEKYIVEEHRQTFFEAYEEFVEKRKLSDWRVRAIRVVIRALRRYELYARRTVDSRFVLDFDTVTPLVLRDFEEFLRNEHTFCGQYLDIYEAVPESRTPQPRGQNTINGILTKLRTFFIWANDVGKTTNNPFRNYAVEECVYGTPYYISIDERNKIYCTNLIRHPQLATQRDIFVFQCLIGCRVGDLYKLTRDNLIGGAVEYIPRKTKDGHPITVRVPLNTIAREILARYADWPGPGLFPLIAEQQYNRAIKRIFLAAGLRRKVTILNPLTREPEQRPIWEVASSHLARRAFVGNLYKQVKDPNLVGALSGHKEGSRAFARYRDIDEEMKTELVKMLE